jgi:dTDP-4-dehydrorhamnose reductase
MTGTTAIHGWPVWQALNDRVEPNRAFGIRPPATTLPAGDNLLAACVADERALRTAAQAFKPTHVIHAAGVCDLDVCEERPDWAHTINVGGARTVAKLFGESCYICYLSADLVFSGNDAPRGGYAETAAPDPLSVAGRSFAAAERHIAACPRACIIRLGLPIGPSVTGAKGAWDWIERRFRRGLPVTLFYDELRSCVSCDRIAATVMHMLAREQTGLFHYGGREQIRLFDLGRAVLRSQNYPPSLLRGIMRNQERNGPPRIGNVSLDSAKLAALLGDWIFPQRGFIDRYRSALSEPLIP